VGGWLCGVNGVCTRRRSDVGWVMFVISPFDGIFWGFGGFFCFFFTPTLPIDDHDGSV
jgi:hypothetical protein